MELNLVCIPGDGIGPEIVREAKKVLDKTAGIYGHRINYTDILMGGASIDVHGVPLTDEAIETAKSADAVLMGSIGGDTNTSPWYKLPPEKRPEAGLLKIRKSLGLFANLRPAVLYPELKGACPLKEEISERHARALLGIENAEIQTELAQQAFDQKMSVREIEKLVRNIGKEKKETPLTRCLHIK